MTRTDTNGHLMVRRFIPGLESMVFIGCNEPDCFHSVTLALPLPDELLARPERPEGISDDAWDFKRMLEGLGAY